MNVARSRAMRLDQQHRDQPDNRRIRFISGNRFRAIANFQSEIDVFADSFLQDVRCFVGRPVIFDQCLANFLGTGAHQFQLALQKKTQAIDRIDVERIADRDHQAGLAESDRNYFETTRVFAADLADDLRRNHHGRDINPIHVCLRCKRARDVHVGDNSVID